MRSVLMLDGAYFGLGRLDYGGMVGEERRVAGE